MEEALTSGTIVDRYRVEADIGAGSMGDVVRAVDVDLKRPVAIKILSDKHRENEELRARFVREARAVAAISHPNVVQVFTTGTFDGRPYIAMELLRGVDLGTVVNDHGVMSSLQAARTALDAARGLEAASKAGLIHRDVKPSNLVLLEDGVVKVTDFGLAKPLDPSNEPALTALGVVVGTPDYIAPEQARGDPIDQRVDIYALGGTLYFLLVGVPPFRKGNPTDDKYLKVVARHLKDPPPDPRGKKPDTDSELAQLGLEMMSKKPDERPDYAHLIERLSAIVERLKGSGEKSQPIATPRRPSTAGQTSPTPFLGGQQRLRVDDDEEPAFVGAGSKREVSDGRVRQPRELDESAQTTVHKSGPNRASVALRPEESLSVQLSAPRTSRALIVATVVAALVFVTGLVLMLFGPIPEAVGTPEKDAAALAPTPDAAPEVKPPPEPPEGMLLVPSDAGFPAFFVATRPVSRGDFAELFPNDKKPGRNRRQNAQPVTGVTYARAVAYAETRSGRLPRAEEWARITALEGVELTELLEWVDDGSIGTQTERSAVGATGEVEKRRPRAHQDVTFRVVQDL